MHFAAQRFENAASAFEAVKTYALERAGGKHSLIQRTCFKGTQKGSQGNGRRKIDGHLDSGGYRSRDEEVLSRLRHERDHRARPARRARRPQARAPAHSFRHERDGPDLDAGLPQVRQDHRRSPRQVPSARRRAGLRRPGAHGPALQHALSAGGRPGQLRLGRRRSAGGHALHRSAPGAHQRRAARGHRKRNRRLHSQFRRDRARARRAPDARSQPAGQWRQRHRRGHGHQHSAAQPEGDHRRHRAAWWRSRTPRSRK